MFEPGTSDSPDGDEAAPEFCLLRHGVFSALGEVTFRRADSDGTPVMIMPMGALNASVPLRALQREFAIGDDTPDGRMLGLIAASLDYVNFLRPGDPLPAEVLTGLASWEPGEAHRVIVANRLRLQLLRWLDPQHPTITALRQLDDDPVFRRHVQAAFEHAAEALGLGAPAEVIALFEALCTELSFIEALRHRLGHRVRAFSDRMHGLAGRRQDGERTQMLIQVQRLAEIGRNAIQGRFAEVDACTSEIMVALRNVEDQQSFIRSNRDWLYRCQRAWEPVLAAWEARDTARDPSMWQLVATTYQFLAPRYMPVQEWRSAPAARAARGRRKALAGMKW